MIVPHSQKKVINFQASIFSIIFAAILLCGVTASFFWFTTESIASAKKRADLKEETRKAQASLEVLKNETSSLLKNAKNFQSALSSTLVSLGLQSVTEAGGENDIGGGEARRFKPCGEENPHPAMVQTKSSNSSRCWLPKATPACWQLNPAL